MNEFLNNLKREAEQNPTAALVVGSLVVGAVAKFLDSAGRAKGSYAYAKDVERRIRQSQ